MKATVQIIADYDPESKTHSIDIIADKKELSDSGIRAGDEVAVFKAVVFDDVYRAEIQTLTRQVGLLADRIRHSLPCRYCPARIGCSGLDSRNRAPDCNERIVRWSREQAEKKEAQ